MPICWPPAQHARCHDPGWETYQPRPEQCRPSWDDHGDACGRPMYTNIIAPTALEVQIYHLHFKVWDQSVQVQVFPEEWCNDAAAVYLRSMYLFIWTDKMALTSKYNVSSRGEISKQRASWRILLSAFGCLEKTVNWQVMCLKCINVPCGLVVRFCNWNMTRTNKMTFFFSPTQAPSETSRNNLQFHSPVPLLYINK